MTTKMVFHGSDIEKICAYYHLNKEDIVKFGANVNPLGLSASVKKEIAEKYLDLFTKKSEIDKVNVQRWLPIIAAVKMEKAEDEELEFLKRCIDIVDYE